MMHKMIKNENYSLDKELSIVKSASKIEVMRELLLANTGTSACEFFYLTQGRGKLCFMEGVFPVEEKDLIMINADTKENMIFKALSPCIFLRISVYPNEMFSSFPPSTVFPIMACSEENIESVIYEIYNELNTKKPLYENIVNSNLSRLIFSILRKLGIEDIDSLKHYDNSKVMAVKSYIDENYSESITIELLASMFHISSSLLSHSFKEKFGLSPIKYLINVRVTMAKILLANTNETIQQISEKVGYINSNYFSILFKKLTGEPPTNFRLNTRRKI